MKEGTMDSKLKPTVGNRLIRRVRRHSNLSVLFREVDGSASHQAIPPSFASLSPTSPPAVPTTSVHLPAPDIELASPNPVTTTPPAAAQPVAQPQPAVPISSSQQAAPIYHEPASPDPTPQPVAPPPSQTPSPAPAVQTTKADDRDDPEWGRLQTIYNLHQRKKTAEAGLPKNPPPAQKIDQNPPPTRPQAVIQREVDVSYPEPAVKQPKTDLQQPPAGSDSPSLMQPSSEADQAAPPVPPVSQVVQTEPIVQSATDVDQPTQMVQPATNIDQTSHVEAQTTLTDHRFQVDRPATPINQATPFEQPVPNPDQVRQVAQSSEPSQLQRQPTLADSDEVVPTTPASLPLAGPTEDHNQEPETSSLAQIPQSDADQSGSPPDPTLAIKRQQATSTSDQSGQIQRALTASPATPPAPSPSNQAVVPETQTETPGSDQPEPIKRDPDPAESTFVESQQPLPLEAVWPVQRQDLPGVPATLSPDRPDAPDQIIPPVNSSTEMTSLTGSEAESAAYIAPAAPAVGPHLQHILQGVATEQPTDSSVEVVPPRRPRPGSVRRSTPTAASPAPPAPDSPPLQRQSDPAVTPSQQTGQEMVTTDIGPLPGDLWGLLGEDSPEESRAEPQTSTAGFEAVLSNQSSINDQATVEVDQGQTVSDTTPGLQRQPIEAASPIQTVEDVSGRTEAVSSSPSIISNNALARAGKVEPQAEVDSETSPQAISPSPQVIVDDSTDEPFDDEGLSVESDIIQRQPLPDEVTETAGEAQADGEETEETQAANDIDTDELARRVYSSIKRKLSVEWERMRRR